MNRVEEIQKAFRQGADLPTPAELRVKLAELRKIQKQLGKRSQKNAAAFDQLDRQIGALQDRIARMSRKV